MLLLSEYKQGGLNNMATIADFEIAKDYGKQAVDTLRYELNGAITTALRTLIDPATGYVDKKKLETPADRATFKDAIETTLTSRFNATAAHLPGHQDTEAGALMWGMTGISRSDIDAYVDNAKGKFDADEFQGYIKKQTDSEKSIAKRLENMRTVMDQVSVADLCTHANGFAPLHTNRVTLDDKMEIYSIHDQLGVVAPKLVADKPYMLP